MDAGKTQVAPRRFTLGALFFMALLGCHAPSALPNPKAANRAAASAAPDAGVSLSFDNRAVTSIGFAYRNGQEAGLCSIVESLGGGVGLLDYDGDGNLDLCLPGGGEFGSERLTGHPTGLFRNLGNLRFESVGLQSGMSEAPHYTHGVAVSDYDNDGFPDLFVTGYGGGLLWTNQGDGTFVSSAGAAGINANRWSSSAAWGDVNGDGNLDLYVANYVNWSLQNQPHCTSASGQREICSPKSFEPLPHFLFISNGDGTFFDGSREAGLRLDGKGLGVVLADLDNDHDLDIYVANDTTPNFLYINDGSGKFEEAGALKGAAFDDQGVSNGSMGVEVCDFNLDGQADLWVANYEHETFALYRNEGQGFFLHVSQATGVTALGQLFVGFGTACADFDRDGDEDFVVANGHVIKYPTAAPRRQVPLYLENREGHFHRLGFAAQNYFSQAHEGRGLAVGDLNNDGGLDLVVSHLNDSIAVLRSDVNDSRRSLRVRLIGVQSNRDGIGARATLKTSGGDRVRQMRGGGSYLSSGEQRLDWGLPRGAKAERLVIQWPSGAAQEIEAPAEGGSLTIVEPVGEERP